jgi:hypothetical protein
MSGRLIRVGLALPPYRPGPGGIAGIARHDMNVQLRHHIPQGADVDLGRSGCCLERSACPRDFFDEDTSIAWSQVMQLDRVRPPRHKDEPRKTCIVHQQHTRQRPIGYERCIGGKPGVKNKFSHAMVLPLRAGWRKLLMKAGA